MDTMQRQETTMRRKAKEQGTRIVVARFKLFK